MTPKKCSSLILVLSAASGAGKTTLCRRLAKRNPQLLFSTSYTTRSPRPGEIDGQDYFFISQKEFFEKIEKDFFVEWAEVHGAFYGTPQESLDEAIKKRKDIVLTLDVQGAFQIKKKYPEALTVFILSPTFEDLERRLKKRKTESQADIQKRLQQAEKEIELSSHYDYRIINRKLEEALKELEGKIALERAKVNR